ncbi:RNA helicase [Phycomyces nitens]|nr:RNA helicase [Phycomyces nitens]
MRWAAEAQASWNLPANSATNHGLDSWREPQKESLRFSHPDQVAFKLNTEIPDRPVFVEKVDFSSYRSKPIVPDPAEIMQGPAKAIISNDRGRRDDTIPNIPINHVRGPYESTDEYLYTHFELMRQDCLIPLQKAVQSYRLTADKPKDKLGLSMSDDQADTVSLSRDYRLYEHVHLNAVVFGSRQVLYRISFRLPYYCRVRWPQSKRLMEGTMVLLSKDNFESDIKIATVVNRGEEPMRGSSRFEYMINIKLECDNDQDPFGFGDPSAAKQETYVMIEAPTGYFEAYRHILTVLKNTQADELPLAPYLVDISQDIRLPYYASQKQYYDIDPSRVTNHREQRRNLVQANVEWPEQNTGMDRTQMDALQTMITNNVAIIQGPPGTGKTFVGTYGMRVLLKNFDQGLGPIVCICQTNHALDQFLEHVLEFDNRVIRIGARSRSDLLKEHVLFEVRKERESVRGIGRVYRKRDEISKKIRELIISMYEEPCVTLDYLRKIKALRPRQLESLKRVGEREARHDSRVGVATNDDSDDDWVISSDITPPRTRGAPTPVPSMWGGNRNPNPNHQEPEKIAPKNPVEIWLKDAIELVNESGVPYSAEDDERDAFLEQQKGLLFDEDDDEDELIEEDELQEITQNFKEDLQDLKGDKSPYINIGSAYRNQSEGFSRRQTNRDEARKVINYKKTDNRGFDSSRFDFFDDAPESQVFQEDDNHDVLERWMKDDDVSMWPLSVRLKAHKKWASQLQKEQGQAIKSLVARYEECSKEIRKMQVKNDALICREARVVGLTSTAAAKYHDLLEEMRPKVMVVEEAAEMLEAHIVTALTQSLQHLILIGDHEQLRPSTAVHNLAKNHFLDVSLFERLVKNDMPYSRLSFQRRMRPEIRTLIDPIYFDPPLQDHPDVVKLPLVRGMDKSLFFLSHTEPESHMEETASKSNEHEAEMAAKLSTYLLMQGYSPADITIITMYSGQRATIKKALKKERKPDIDTSLVQVSSVDGYQGEENKIIILSLVRSNSAGMIGFLSIANRVCVSLSRAKHGMYILGNARLLCEKSDLWNEIVSNLEDKNTGNIGVRLTLKCVRHNELTEVQWPVDFSDVEEGGCTRPCGTVLDCGHPCPLKCHVYEHDLVRCQLPCRKVFQPCGHACTRRCFEACGSCLTPRVLRLPCGHELREECGKIKSMLEKPTTWRCKSCPKP